MYHVGDEVIFNKDHCWRSKWGEYPATITNGPRGTDESNRHWILAIDNSLDDGIKGAVSFERNHRDYFEFSCYEGFFGPADRIDVEFDIGLVASLL